MAESPFNKSVLTRRSPPPTPTHPPPAQHGNDQLGVVPTAEIQNWMISIEQCLNEVCSIAAEGKLNSDQKVRIHNLCRKVSHGTSQLAVQYQSVKRKTIEAHNNMQTLKENLDLSQRIQDLKQSVEECSKPAPGTVSFADMVKKTANSFVQPSNIRSVAIYPTDKMKSSDDTKSLVQKIVRPEQMKLHVRGLRKTINGGVIISTDTKDDIEKLKQLPQLTSSGLTVAEPNKRQPRVIIIGVPTSLQETEVFNCLYQQNLAEKLQAITLESFLSAVKLSHKSGKKDAATCNYILQVPAQIRKALVTNERVFVNWSSCPVRDFTLVTRCFKCQQYGHAAKTCREEASTCGHCGDVGHALKDCTKKTEPSKCATCLRFNKPNAHKTGDNDCPAKKAAEARYIDSVDYEGS